MTGGQQAAVLGVAAPGMASQVATLPSGMVPVGTVSPPGIPAGMPPQGIVGYPQQQGIVGSVTQPDISAQMQLGMMGTVPHSGKIGL